MELPLIVFNPTIDIVLIALVFNLCAYVAYAKLYGKEFNKVVMVSFRLSLAELVLVVANYGVVGTMVTVAGRELHWLWWYVAVSVPLEVIFFGMYKWYYGLSWQEIAGE